MELKRYTTPEGLVPTSSLRWDGDCLRLADSSEQVWPDPMLHSVVQFLRKRVDLWRIAQVHVLPWPVIQWCAPMFGVPFDVALQQLVGVGPHRRIIKSMFKRFDADHIYSAGRGLVATMVAHLAIDVCTTGPEVTLEAWQVLDLDAETFYLHGLFSVNRGCFKHFDGAIMYHDAEAKLLLFDQGVKVKGQGKKKYFRLDGVMSLEDVRALGVAFLPLEDLATEYLLTQHVAVTGDA